MPVLWLPGVSGLLCGVAYLLIALTTFPQQLFRPLGHLTGPAASLSSSGGSYSSYTGPADSSVFPYKGVINVTLAWVFHFYFLLFGQVAVFYGSYAKIRQKAKKDGEVPPSVHQVRFSGTDPVLVAADRSVGNQMEQSLLFLPVMWVCAFFYSPLGASRIGSLWMIFRSLFPFTYYAAHSDGGASKKWVKMSLIHLFVCTIPAYVCVLTMVLGVLQEVNGWSTTPEDGKALAWTDVRGWI